MALLLKITLPKLSDDKEVLRQESAKRTSFTSRGTFMTPLGKYTEAVNRRASAEKLISAVSCTRLDWLLVSESWAFLLDAISPAAYRQETPIISQNLPDCI